MKRGLIQLAIFGLILLAVCCDLSIASPMDSALNYLMQSQNQDGSWGKQLDLQATAFAIVALETAGENCAADKSHLASKEYKAAYELALQLLGTKQNAIAQKLLALQKDDGS